MRVFFRLETGVFERRLSVLLAVLGIAAVAIVARLVELQIVRGDEFRRRANRTLVLRPESLPFVRGSILDRDGKVLVRDAPSWEIQVDYSVIALEPRHIERHVRQWKRKGRYGQSVSVTKEDVRAAFAAEVERMWRELAAFESVMRPVTTEELMARGAEVHRRVLAIRHIVARNRGFYADVAEERDAHGIVKGLDQQRQIEAREAFADYPWVHVEPVSRRTYAEGSRAFAHILGRLGRVDARDVANDPQANDLFAKYLGTEFRGKSGVEYAAERKLRGRRGRMTLDREGRIVDDGLIEAENGEDVTLAISDELQRRLYELVDREVQRIANSPGGAVVVLDVATREVLAMVSYPSYDQARFNELYSVWRDDTERLPLLFRAVANRYAPGSTIKPLVCLAGLTSGKITLGTRINCSGYMFEDARDRWRCWQISGTNVRKAHGAVDVVEALRGSCNVFMYHVGQDVGVDVLCSHFDMFGLGKFSGVGLREESRGINPWPYYLAETLNRPVTPGSARLFAIGQGEVAATPVQMANVFATYASGRYRPVTLIRDEEPTAEWVIPAKPEYWAAIRQGMYEVVNHPDGTAHKYVRFVSDRYALCGKTGSATANPWPTSYRIMYQDEEGGIGEEIVPAGARQEAIDRFVLAHPAATFDPAEVQKASTWPSRQLPKGEHYSHAWFGGFLQAIDENRQPDFSIEPRIAFAVLIEFGGSGGRTSGPIGTRVAETVLDLFGPELDY